MAIYPYQGIMPRIDPSAFVHPEAVVIGDVEIGADASLWPGVVVRGDVNFVRIGARVNVQDGSILHVSRPGPAKPQGSPLLIGDGVTIGHRVILHGCRLEEGCMVGMGAVVMDDVVVATDGMVAAGALVAPNKRVGVGELWLGSPAKLARLLSDQERAAHRAIADHYVTLAKQYAQSLG